MTDKWKYMNMLATETKNAFHPYKSEGVVHHHQEAVWKVWEIRKASKGQGREAHPQ